MTVHTHVIIFFFYNVMIYEYEFIAGNKNKN